MGKVEIVELGYPQSIIQRENEPITELIETELTPETFTINDMYVEAKLLFDCQDQLKELQIENKQLKESIKELEETIENMKAIAGEKIEPVNGISSVDYQEEKTTMTYYTNNTEHTMCCAYHVKNMYRFCPNCGRKIIRK